MFRTTRSRRANERHNATQRMIDDARERDAFNAHCDAIERHTRLRETITHIATRDIERACDVLRLR
jgi:CRISPR/Cas system-associated endonuclease/helicase Cas3